MLKSFLRAAVLLTSLFAGAVDAQAGTIILFGDVDNLALNGAIPPGNQMFFKNILGSGTRVVISGGSVDKLNNFYNGLSGVSSSVLTGPITSTALSGTNLFISMLPTAPFSSEELTVLASFEGDIAFLGENPVFSTQNARINAALGVLGSSMSILNIGIDPGPQTATGSQIAADPYTLGITSFGYGGASQISVGSGKALFYGKGGEPFIGYEVVGVSEPISLLLIGLGLGGLWVARRQ